MSAAELRRIVAHEGRVAARAHVLAARGWALMAVGSLEMAVNVYTGQGVPLGTLRPGNAVEEDQA